MAGMTIIVRTISRLLFPFIFLFGVNIVLHGHSTSGGGFSGGVITAGSVVMLLLAYGIERAETKISFLRAEVLVCLGGLVVAFLGILGMIFGVYFLQNVFPGGEPGQLFSGGNLSLLYLGAGITVTAGIILIFYAMARGFREEG